jgi:hypothetical protein
MLLWITTFTAIGLVIPQYSTWNTSSAARCEADLMRRMTTSLLFGTFMGLLAYVSADRLLEWCRTGQLAAHKKPVLGGSDVLTYSGDPIGFTIEFDLYLFLLTMGALGVLMAFRDTYSKSLARSISSICNQPMSLSCVHTGFSPVAY